VETVPVPHGVRVVLPCLPAHGVDLFHVRVLVVITPPIPATVVACGGVDHGTVRGGGRGERGQSEQGDGHKNECAGDPARDSGCGVLRLHCVLRCSQPGRLSNGSAPKRVDYPWNAEPNHTRGKEVRTARAVTAMTSKGPKRHRPSGSGEAIGVGTVAVGKPFLITERSIIRPLPGLSPERDSVPKIIVPLGIYISPLMGLRCSQAHSAVTPITEAEGISHS